MLRVRSALRAGDWIDAEAQMKGWETMALDPYALDELKRVEIELEDRNVVNCLELYVLSSGSTSGRSMAASMGASIGSRSQHRSRGSNTRAGTSVQGVLLEGLRQALTTIETQGWTPRSNQAIGLHEAAVALASIYAAVDARNWTESLNVLNAVSAKSGQEHWSSMLWEETWDSIRVELVALRRLVENESTTDRLRNCLIRTARLCSEAGKYFKAKRAMHRVYGSTVDLSS